MTLGKREKLMIAALVSLLYIFIGARFVIMPAIPKIKDANTQLSMVQKKIKQYDADLLTLDSKKAQLDSLSANNERLDSYLLESADMPDAIEYLDNLSNVIGVIDKATINYPALRSSATGIDTDPKSSDPNAQVANAYYEVKLNLEMKLTQQQVMNLINFVEGGSLKVRISKLEMKPSTTANSVKQMQQLMGNAGNDTSGTTAQPLPRNQLFDIKMDICLYSINPELSDKLYDYGRFKFNRYKENKGMLFTATSSGVADNSLNSEASSRPDIEIKEGSFMTVGPNIEIIGANKSNDILRVRTKDPQNISITMAGKSFTIDTVDETGAPLSLTGAIPDKDMEIFIKTDFHDINENKNLFLNVSIKNDSGKQVRITVNDTNKRVKISDRNGKEIIGMSDTEKAYIS